MDGGIYLIREDGELVEMTGQAYDSEDLLQGLLARYPRLLAGDQIDSAAPRRWLLISRETPVPAEEEGSGRWSVDHLFLDQDAVPTLVEVKRSSDTRIRREVVGQMLDYAANAVVYWPIERIRAQFESTCERRNSDPDDVLGEFLGPDADPEDFWQRVKTNLQAGKVRLLFVADQIPPELRRVVEFLNAQMDPAEVLAVEIRQYVGEELKTLVPRVIGQTIEAERKRSPRAEPWNRERFFAALAATSPAEDVALAQAILDFALEVCATEVQWGRGKDWGSFNTRLIVGNERYSLFSVYTDGRFSLNIGWNHQKLARLAADLPEKYRAEAKSRLGLDFDRIKWERGWPMAKLSALLPDNAGAFKEVVREFVSETGSLASPS
jgi:hypothetical protein